MKEEIINQIQLQMLPYLNNEQLKALQSVLEHTFYSVTITTKNVPDSTNRNAVTAFIAAKRIEGCSEKTLTYYQNTIQAMISGIDKTAQQITTEDLRAYLTTYQSQHKTSRVTIDNIRRILSSFFSWLEDEDYIVKSPVRRIHKVKTAKVIKETYTDEALELMRDNAPSLRDLAIIVNVAISSLKMSDDNFRLAHMKRPNRSYDRYQKIALLVNTALKESANLLVMPEACTPLEWLPVLARTSSRNNMAIITGVEHIFSGTNVYNLTAVILPYTDRKTGAQGAHIFYHSKNHFAPGELQLIRGNILQPFEGNGSSKNQSSYELYNWNDFLFSVYCCYELTSIADRSIFQSFADAIIAVEWNHDVNYYSNIIESLSRDVHCYCIQVNTSDYGDSRITQPTKTEKKDILRTKGGANAAVLVGKIEIAKLREFQAKTYELQKDDSTYKPTPPNFNSRIAYQKSTGQLSADIIKELFTPKSLLASHPFGAVKYS